MQSLGTRCPGVFQAPSSTCWVRQEREKPQFISWDPPAKTGCGSAPLGTGRDGDGSISPRENSDSSRSSAALGTKHPWPSSSQRFYFNRETPSRVSFTHPHVEGSDGQTQDRPRRLGQLVKIFVKKQTAAIGLSPSAPAATNALLRAPSSLPPKPPAGKLTSCVVQQQQMSSMGCRGDWKSLCFNSKSCNGARGTAGLGSCGDTGWAMLCLAGPPQPRHLEAHRKQDVS